MSLLGVLGAITGIGTIATQIGGLISNKKNQDYQKEYNQQVFERADDAFQRAAVDLEKAGLSKTLAAGYPAQVAGNSSSPHSADVGQILGNAFQGLLGAVSSLSETKADVDLKNAQADYYNSLSVHTVADTGRVNAVVEQIGVDMDLTKAQTDKAKQEVVDLVVRTDQDEWNLLTDRLYGVNPHISLSDAKKNAPVAYEAVRLIGANEAIDDSLQKNTGLGIIGWFKKIIDSPIFKNLKKGKKELLSKESGVLNSLLDKI